MSGLLGSVAKGAAKSAIHAGTHLGKPAVKGLKRTKAPHFAGETPMQNLKSTPKRIKAQGQAFTHAVKHTPGESLGKHIQEHRVGTAFTVVGTAADAADIADNRRRSSHVGIDNK